MMTGVLSILGGATTGRELLEFPPETAFILFLGLAMVGLWAITTHLEQEIRDHLYFAMVSSGGVFVVRLDVCDREYRAGHRARTRGCAAGDQLVVRRQFGRSLAHSDRLGDSPTI